MRRVVVVSFVVLLALALIHSPRAYAQDMPPPPALGATIVDTPLTSEGLFRSISCPTGLTSADFGPDGYRLSVAGRCRPTEDYAAVSYGTSVVALSDGDVRIKVKVTAGIERAILTLNIRLKSGSWYRLAWLPATGTAFLAKYPNGQESIMTRRTDLPPETTLETVHTMAVRAQGSQIWGLIDDRPVLVANDTLLDVGDIGIDLLRIGGTDDTFRVSAVVQELKISALAASPPGRVPAVQGSAPTAANTGQPAPTAAATSTASGSCGPARGQYGLTGISAEMFGLGARTVPSLYYKVDYDLSYPTTLGLLARYNDEVGGIEFILNTWPSTGTRGSYEGAWHAEIRPERQGAGDGFTISSGRYDGPANSQWTSQLQSGYYGLGGLTPGGWHFYVYMGEWGWRGDIPRFIVDERTGPIGKFGCNVADDDAKN